VKKKSTYQEKAVSLFESYAAYKELGISQSLIKHSEVISLLDHYSGNSAFNIEFLGKSVEGREIGSVKFGRGKIHILAWSQMHGDEPTATAAIFDLLKFFNSDDQFNGFRDLLLDRLTFHFIPMLNPDGAENFRRENGFNIDLNRDALRLESPESQILWQYAMKTKPGFGFNLHDQKSYYSAGYSGNAVGISLLAPPSCRSKMIDYTREKSMQVVLGIFDALTPFIPGHIARYNDDFEPRAFGDNLVKSGISVILIESGFFKNDQGKEIIRKLNFTALLSAFDSIALDQFSRTDYRRYFEIPENKELFFDLLLKNLEINYAGSAFLIDIGIKREKYLDPSSGRFMFKGKITEIGDLSLSFGIEESDLSGYRLISPERPATDDPANLKIVNNSGISIEVTDGFLKYS
jgi:Zinc carboxypeptidase